VALFVSGRVSETENIFIRAQTLYTPLLEASLKHRFA